MHCNYNALSLFIKCKNNMWIKTHTHTKKYLTHVQQQYYVN